MKKTTLLGSLILGIIAVLAVIVIMSTTGLLGSDATTTLVFSSNNGEGIYNGKPLTKDGWQLVSGELEKGHTVSAERTEGENQFCILHFAFRISHFPPLASTGWGRCQRS